MSRGLSSSFFPLLLALTLAVVASATPVVQVRDNFVRLPIAKKFNLTGSSTVLARDQLRVKRLLSKANARLSGEQLSSDAVISVPADNQAVSYIASVSLYLHQRHNPYRLVTYPRRSALATLQHSVRSHEVNISAVGELD